MSTVQGIGKTETNQTVTPTASATSSSDPTQGTEFDVFLRAHLSPSSSGKVSEEALFSGVVRERLKKVKGEDALKEFEEEFSAQQQAKTSADGYVPYEEVTKSALKALVESSTITQEEGDSIYAQSFAASQLDSNTQFLFDDRGGANDPTMAVEEMNKALTLARAVIEGFDSGSTTAETRTLSEVTPSKASIMGTSGVTGTGTSALTGGSPVDGPGGFVWKPSSEKNGNLVVISKESLAGQIAGVQLVGADGKVIETGTYSGIGNGGRDHFRFSQPGASYPPSLTVQFLLKNGEMESYTIDDPSKRWD